MVRRDRDQYVQKFLGMSSEEREKCKGRRDRVLQHPAIAARLTARPLNFTRPEQWTGYIPPAVIEGPNGPTTNRSNYRRALIDICTDVLAAEDKARREAIDGPPAESSSPPDIAPQLVNTKQLAKMHILMQEAGLDSREDEHEFIAEIVGHPIETSKELTMGEGSRVIQALIDLMPAQALGDPDSVRNLRPEEPPESEGDGSPDDLAATGRAGHEQEAPSHDETTGEVLLPTPESVAAERDEPALTVADAARDPEVADAWPEGSYGAVDDDEPPY